MRYLLLSLLLIFSCTKKSSPEDVLSSFVKYRFQANQTREALLEKTTGLLYQNINEMDEETFKRFISSGNLKMRKYKATLTRCSEESCFITYTMSYDESDKDGRKYETEIKKIAELKNEEGTWKISDVSNVKTFIDSKRPISTSNQTKK